MEQSLSTVEKLNKLSKNDEVDVDTEYERKRKLEVCQIKESHEFDSHDGIAVCLTKGGDWPCLILVSDFEKNRVFSYTPTAVMNGNKFFEDMGIVKNIKITGKSYSNRDYRADDFL